jgi:lipopolysaccharide/colanic/teichoic acid biosynthesis glycosyltransferase
VKRNGIAYEPLKRLIDLVGAIVCLALLTPMLVATAALVARSLGRPIIFRQARAGLHGEPFTLVKFRTMRPVDVARGLVTDADRLIRVGRLLRSWSLDELPSLWNVLRGEMSLVGPRPLPVSYLDRYTARQARRHEVRPGVTGLAQVRGRNGLSWEEKLRLDVEYVEHRCLRLDARILAETAHVVVRREGVSAAGHATVPEFLGTGAGDGRGPAG